MKESDIQTIILAYLKSKNIFSWRSYNGPMIHGRGHFCKTQNPGMPDIMGILPCGRSVQIEVKLNEKANKSKHQIEWIKKARENGAIAFFAWSLSQVRSKLDKCSINCKPNCCSEYSDQNL